MQVKQESRYVPSVKPKVEDTESKDMIPKKKESMHQYSIRWYNCNKSGHVATDCKQPKREKEACFKCFEIGHQSKDCPKCKEQINNIVDLPMDHDFYQEDRLPDCC